MAGAKAPEVVGGHGHRTIFSLRVGKQVAVSVGVMHDVFAASDGKMIIGNPIGFPQLEVSYLKEKYWLRREGVA